MNISPIRCSNGNCVVIDDFYTEGELLNIYLELRQLPPTLQAPQETGVALDENGVSKKLAKGVFLDELYTDNRDASNILRINRKLFSEELTSALVDVDVFYKYFRNSTRDTTLVNFYGDGEYYKPHEDFALFTAVSFFKFGKFSGGDMYLPELNVTIPSIENRLVIFPGATMHEVKTVSAEPDNYRVTMAQFINYERNNVQGN